MAYIQAKDIYKYVRHF